MIMKKNGITLNELIELLQLLKGNKDRCIEIRKDNGEAYLLESVDEFAAGIYLKAGDSLTPHLTSQSNDVNDDEEEFEIVWEEDEDVPENILTIVRSFGKDFSYKVYLVKDEIESFTSQPKGTLISMRSGQKFLALNYTHEELRDVLEEYWAYKNR